MGSKRVEAMEAFRNFILNFSPPAGQIELNDHKFVQSDRPPAQTRANTYTRTLEDLVERLNDSSLSIQVLKPGAIVAGRYEIISMIGSGGMGIIYKARDPQLDKYYALKMMHRHQLDDRALKRFKQEAKAASQLTHPKLLAVRDFGFSESGNPFMIMDFIDGVSLSDVLRAEGSLRNKEAINIFLQICDGMQYAHAQGVLHRDLKPSNVMLTKFNTLVPVAKVVDFGIAKIDCGLSQQADGVTSTGEILGSPLYMSPEQATGKYVDQRSDIYSMGCLIYETLTGRPPFKGDSTLETMIQHLQKDPPALCEKAAGRVFPKALEVVVQKTLAKNPDDRYQSMVELRDALLIVLADQTAKVEAINLRAKRRRISPYFFFLLPAFLVAGTQRIPHQTTRSPTGAPAATIASLPWSPKLSNLALKGIRLSTTQMNGLCSNHIAKLHSLQTLDLARTNIDDDGMHHLKDLPLTSLSLAGDSLIGDPSLISICRMSQMRNLQLNNTNITSDGIARLCYLRRLQVLNLDHTHITDQGIHQIVRTFAKTRSLEELDIAGTLVTDKGIADISRLPSLKTLSISGLGITDSSVARLERMVTLKKLLIQNCNKISESAKTRLKLKLNDTQVQL
jgi:serine/threonine protein kinase